ncbi:hypothetical protein SCA6_000996 [Theobroma cacao]
METFAEDLLCPDDGNCMFNKENLVMELLSVIDSCHVAQSCQMSNSVWLKSFDFKRLPKHHMAPLIDCISMFNARPRRSSILLVLSSSNSKNWIKSEVKSYRIQG